MQISVQFYHLLIQLDAVKKSSSIDLIEKETALSVAIIRPPLTVLSFLGKYLSNKCVWL